MGSCGWMELSPGNTLTLALRSLAKFRWSAKRMFMRRNKLFFIESLENKTKRNAHIFQRILFFKLSTSSFMMNALKKLLVGGGKKKSKKESQQREDKCDDSDGEHFGTDFDKTFEEAAKKTSTTVPQIIDYRGSPARANRSSKSPSPYQSRITSQRQQQNQSHPIKKVSSAIGNRTPTRMRKGSAPVAYKVLGDSKSMTPEKDLMKRKMTESQQKRAKDIVESLDWIKPAEESSVKPLIERTETISPQHVHVCEMIPLPRANQQWAVAVIPQRQVALLSPPLAASGKVRVPVATNNR